MNATFGRNRQSFMLPATEFYLRPGRRRPRAEVRFLCTPNLTAGFNALARRWGLRHEMSAHEHASAVRSGELSVRNERAGFVSRHFVVALCLR